MQGRHYCLCCFYVVATLVTADCILGNNVDPTLPLVTSGQFINIDRPAKCHGNITAWHFCYYPSSVLSTDVNTFVVWFRIWRPTTGNSYQLIFNFQKFGITVERRDSIECETTEAQNVTIQPGDVIGIYMPDAISTVSALAFDPPAEQAGVFMDTRGDTVQLLSVGIQQRNLARRSNIGLHLYASTSKCINSLHVTLMSYRLHCRCTCHTNAFHAATLYTDMFSIVTVIVTCIL